MQQHPLPLSPRDVLLEQLDGIGYRLCAAADECWRIGMPGASEDLSSIWCEFERVRRAVLSTEYGRTGRKLRTRSPEQRAA